MFVNPPKPFGLGLVISHQGLQVLPPGDLLAICLTKLGFEKAGIIKFIVLGT